MSEINRPAVRLPGGEVVAMPDPPEFSEFALPGNFRGYPDAGIFAFYDPTTMTGATYFAGAGSWALQQPVDREVFWLHSDLLAKTTAGRELAQALTDDVLAGLAKLSGRPH